MLLAFVVGGLVVLITGHNPISTYKAIFDGTGLNWFFPWTSGPLAPRRINLQQTLLATTPLILTGLAVAFAFRCGMFNIGGQGQYHDGRDRGGLGRRRRSWACRTCHTCCSRWSRPASPAPRGRGSPAR